MNIPSVSTFDKCSSVESARDLSREELPTALGTKRRDGLKTNARSFRLARSFRKGIAVCPPPTCFAQPRSRAFLPSAVFTLRTRQSFQEIILINRAAIGSRKRLADRRPVGSVFPENIHPTNVPFSGQGQTTAARLARLAFHSVAAGIIYHKSAAIQVPWSPRRRINQSET